MAVPQGTVTVTDSGNTIASGVLDANGNAALSWTAVAGTYNFIVNYGGGPGFDPGASAPIPYTVNAVNQQVVVNVSVQPPSPVDAGTAVSFNVSVAGV